MRKAVGVLKELSADETTRMRYENREKALRDIESMKDEDILKAKIEIAKNFLRMNLPIEQIVKGTGLTRTEVEKICDADK